MVFGYEHMSGTPRIISFLTHKFLHESTVNSQHTGVTYTIEPVYKFHEEERHWSQLPKPTKLCHEVPNQTKYPDAPHFNLQTPILFT